MNSIVFICRASVRDGLGHLIRTKSVVLASADSENCSVVIIGDKVAEPVLAGVHFEYVIFDHENKLEAYVREKQPHLIVFDMLYLQEDTFFALKKLCKTASLSPIFNFQSEVNLSFSRTKYEADMSIRNEPKHLRGLDYTTITPFCERISEESYKHVLNKNPFSIAICMGGADSLNMTLQALEIVRGISTPLLFWVMVGEGYSHSYQTLIDCVKKDTIHEIIVAKTTQSMWRILSGCAFAILACGITTYEAVYAGLPSVNIVSSDDQIFLIRELEEKGVAFSLLKHKGDFEDMLVRMIEDANRNRDQLLSMHKRGKVLIDGLGAFRIIKELNALIEGQ